MKPQAKTLIEKQGFLDPDRSSPSHDDIHLWVFENLSQVLESFSPGQKEFEILHKEMEYPIIQASANYKSIIGFIDVYANGVVTNLSTEERKRFDVCIEIKSKIPSCGDLIRQVQFYKKFQSWQVVWIVISPDDRFSKVLKEQGIYFYRCALGGRVRDIV